MQTVEGTTTNKGLSSLTSTGALDNQGTIYLKDGSLQAASLTNSKDATIETVKTLKTTGTDENTNAGKLTFTGTGSSLTTAGSLTNTGTVENLTTASVTGTLTNKKAEGDESAVATIGFTGDAATLTVTGKLDNQTGASITGLHSLDQNKGTAETTGVTNAGTLSFNGAGSSMSLEGDLDNQTTGVIENLARLTQTGTDSKITNAGRLGDVPTEEKASTLSSIESQGTVENTGSIYLNDGSIKAATLTNEKDGESAGTIEGIKTIEATTVTNTKGTLAFNGDEAAKLTATNSLTNTGSITGLKEISQRATSGDNLGITNSGTLGDATDSKLTTISTAATLNNTGSIYLTGGSVTAATFTNTKGEGSSAAGSIASVTSLEVTGSETSSNAGTVTFTGVGSTLTSEGSGSFTNTGKLENLGSVSVKGNLTNGDGSTAAEISLANGSAATVAVDGKLENKTDSTITGLNTLTTGTSGSTSGESSLNAGELSFTGESAKLTANSGFTNSGTITGLAEAEVTGTFTNSGSVGEETNATLTSLNATTKVENTGSIYFKDGTLETGDLSNTGNGKITGLNTATVSGSFVNGEDSPATTSSTVDFSGAATEKTLSITGSGSLTNNAIVIGLVPTC